MPNSAAQRWGVFGGSFNPPHLGHLLLVHYLLGRGLVDRVLVLPCFAHAFGKDLCSFSLRCRWLAEIFASDPRVEVCGVEASLAQSLGHAPRTLEVLEHLETTHPERRYHWILGQDILDSGETARWYRWPEIESRFAPIVVPRASATQPGPLPAISSSELRAAWVNPAKADWLKTQLPAPVRQSWQAAPTTWPPVDPIAAPRDAWVIGQGKAGRSMLAWLRAQGVAAQGISARMLLATGEPAIPASWPSPGLIWLATRPSDAQGVLQRIKQRITTGPGNPMICSASGAYSAEDLNLAPYCPAESDLGTLHPIMSLTGEAAPLDRAYFGWSGSDALGQGLRAWLGSERLIDLSELDAAKRLRYHAACALVSNYWGGVREIAQEQLTSMGLGGQRALDALMRQSVENLVQEGIPAGVSGPLVRGQEKQVQLHQAQWNHEAAALHAALVDAMRLALGGMRNQASSSDDAQ